MRRAGLALAGTLFGLATVPAMASAVTLEPIGTATYDAPTYVTSDPSNPDRLFVTEQDGTIWETTPSGTRLYLDLTQETELIGEEGLWSIAFAPDFATSRRFYVAYSDAGHDPTIDEYQERATPAETEATRREVLEAEDNAASSNHNGGQLQFGRDGLLYWSVGDDANAANAQDPGSLRGKIVRIDPRTAAPSAAVWALGLRNPWRFSFDRATGAMLIADVGANTFEEVDVGLEGGNYGWPDCEGPCGEPSFVEPIYAYAHTFNPSGMDAIAGGYVVRDPDLAELVGRYVFADTYSGQISSIDPASPPPTNGHRFEGLTVSFPVSFGEDACGRVYVVSAGEGQVYRLEGPTGGACPPTPPVAADTDPPQTSLKLKRKNDRGTRWVARLRSDEPGSTFECRLDQRRWKPCGAKRRLKNLDPGRHRFRARATDAAGNTDPKPAKDRFRTKRRR